MIDIQDKFRALLKELSGLGLIITSSVVNLKEKESRAEIEFRGERSKIEKLRGYLEGRFNEYQIIKGIKLEVTEFQKEEYRLLIHTTSNKIDDRKRAIAEAINELRADLRDYKQKNI